MSIGIFDLRLLEGVFLIFFSSRIFHANVKKIIEIFLKWLCLLDNDVKPSLSINAESDKMAVDVDVQVLQVMSLAMYNA